MPSSANTAAQKVEMLNSFFKERNNLIDSSPLSFIQPALASALSIWERLDGVSASGGIDINKGMKTRVFINF